MIDTLIIHIPVSKQFVKTVGNLHSIVGDVADYQIKAVPSYLKRDLETGQVTWGELKHPFESLPSNYGSMAIKFYSHNVANTLPYIALNASPKLLQGHNVYGSSDLYPLACEMLGLLEEVYPFFCSVLDFENARVSRLDVTLSIKLPHERLVQPCLRFLANVSNGHRRNDTDRRDFYNTVYFGGQTSPWGGAKVYGKQNEVENEIKELTKKADGGCTQSKKKLEIFNPELLAWSSCILRFESKNKRKILEKLGYPTNLWELCRYLRPSKTDPHQTHKRLYLLWRYWFDPILNALKGEVMLNADDNQIYDLCKEKLVTYTKSGKQSLTKANNAFNFYKLLRSDGWSEVKARYQIRAFNINVKSLCDIGVPRAVLQNLNNQQVTAYPVVELLTLQLDRQFPADYVPPVSQYIDDYKHFLKPKLKFVV